MTNGRLVVVTDDFGGCNMVVPDNFGGGNMVVPDKFGGSNMVITDDSGGSNLVVVVTYHHMLLVNNMDLRIDVKIQPVWYYL